MNSGIGDREELSALGIEPSAHLPDVGKNLTDQPLLGMGWLVEGSGSIFVEIGRNASLANELLGQWNQSHTGPLADTLASHLVFLRISDSAALRQMGDPSAGPHTAHYEIGISVGRPFLLDCVCINAWTSRTVLVSPNPLLAISSRHQLSL